ncbi:GAS2-like protein 2 [Elysia marginata]|uniref:GAS2-like protein 2 n=1 Tax=Elysia marginata TaxID=1093978 RepID=A0AAV4IGC3_9GAST|nr:GAS2-like protein 2 [Elysia marginata]
MASVSPGGAGANMDAQGQGHPSLFSGGSVQENARQLRERGETLEMRSYFIRSVPERNVQYRENVKPETFQVQENARQLRERGETLEMRSYFIRSVPERNVQYRENVKPETFQARDNISNFISWGRQLGIPEVLSFETDDLVLRKNEKSVILCLLELARVGAKLGMLAPTLVQMEEEIDAELAGEEPKPQVQVKTCDMRSLDERISAWLRYSRLCESQPGVLITSNLKLSPKLPHNLDTVVFNPYPRHFAMLRALASHKLWDIPSASIDRLRISASSS